MISLHRLEEIRSFHTALSTRYLSDRAAINALERQAVLSMMAELINHAEETLET